MARVTAVIDIGSNSARMAIFERSSRFGFHLLREVKSRVRISENAYKNGGYLQIEAMNRAIGAIRDFVTIAKSYGARKLLVVATSAVRDAPNKSQFLSRAKSEAGLQIRVISGRQEAYFGGVAAANLIALGSDREAITIDIGGGSTELALIKSGRVVGGVSFNLGTVRLKELFFDRDGGKDAAAKAAKFAREAIAALPAEFRSATLIGVGGTMRALASALIKDENYPLEVLHGYEFSLDDRRKFIDRVIAADAAGLKSLGFKSDRLDVIREGTLIFRIASEAIGAKRAIVSGVGVREGVFLSDLLRSEKGKLPSDIQPSLISVVERFGDKRRQIAFVSRLAGEIFDLIAPRSGIGAEYKRLLLVAAKLLGAGAAIEAYYPAAQEGFLAQNALAYGFTHGERLLISTLLRSHSKKDLTALMATEEKGWKEPFYDRLLPNVATARVLAGILYLAQTLNTARSLTKPVLELRGDTLLISNLSYLARETLSRYTPPIGAAITII